MKVSKNQYNDVLEYARSLVKEDLARTEEIILGIAKNAPQGISSRLEKLFSRKGKRIRSTLLCLIARSGTKEVDRARIAHACASIELLHLASLVHDDIIDNTEIRRGVRTAHQEWGNKIAVLIGDYVLSQAMRCVIHEQKRDLPVILSNAANDLIAGEIMELDESSNMDLSYDRYNLIVKNKTAALVEASARIGAILADYEADMVEKCAEMGVHFGLAFQIIDDLLDYGVGAEDLDKHKFTDINNGLITLPLIFFFKNSSEAQSKEMKSLIASVEEEGVPQKIVQRLIETSCIEQTKEVALDHLDLALSLANGLPDSKFAEALKNFFASMSFRSN